MPVAVVPLLNTIDPLTPAGDVFADRIITLPDDDTAPAPLTTVTLPPVFDDEVVEPAYKYSPPPFPLFVLPTATDIGPAEPRLARPETTSRLPTLPLDDVPERRVR